MSESVVQLRATADAGEREAVRTGTTVDALNRALRDNLFYVLARFPDVASRNDYYLALAYTVRDRLLHRWIQSAKTFKDRRSRTVCYFSAEFLIGPQLLSNLMALGLESSARAALASMSIELDDLIEQEEEPGLGNGGLGRLAACYMESAATQCIPAIGYGIRYEFGIFDQSIRDGWQVESVDRWLRLGYPWEIPRPEIAFNVRLGGSTEHRRDESGRLYVRWHPERVVKGVAHDLPIPGFGVANANFLRLFSSEAPEVFDLQAFNYGDYYGAIEDQVAAENLTKVLYPNDGPIAGKRLRLEQQYFFVTCALQDMVRIFQQSGRPLGEFAVKYVVQLNDTHPAVAIAELMRLFIDEHGMTWEQAWSVTYRVFAYTNHTLLPEALERWPVELFGRVLPRHLEIVFEINRRFLDEVRARWPGDDARVRRMSLIDEDGERYVRMANLACVGSFAVNGVARLHTELLQRDVLRDFYELWPEKFRNVTNGVTPRRFMQQANPGLAELITSSIGPEWVRDLDRLRLLEPLADDAEFRERWRRAKRAAKETLTRFVRDRCGVTLDPGTLFDVQVKRIHEYKRQHLNVLHVIGLYLRMKRDASSSVLPRTVLFGGKAAPGYFMAKLIIKFINAIGECVNSDPDTRDRLRVVFIPDFNVKSAHRIYPGADLSQQISLAGKEASGTGNMKFAMNGALTIGTLDGANVEIREAVGRENFFLFGHDADEVARMKAHGYNPRRYYEDNPGLREIIDLIAGGAFSRGDTALFRPLVDALLGHDEYLLLADYQSYIECQAHVEHAFRDLEHWTRMSILNVARIGRFSSDRSVTEYAREIWNIEPVALAP